MKTPVVTPNAPSAIGPYSQAIVSGQAIYVSGQLPIDPATGTMPDLAADQARQSLTNIKAILEAAGATMEDVTRTGVFLTDLADFQAVNEVYATFFRAPYPARSSVEVKALPKGAKVEIEALAIK
ncbi:MAG: RidA family protein [Deltaproteobacteria bacterium]|jgi:2-iminobutanoate/2-iminopropanoate deaminase|nr:RidA family protein [Deltaproteobacteria bacterium]